MPLNSLKANWKGEKTLGRVYYTVTIYKYNIHKRAVYKTAYHPNVKTYKQIFPTKTKAENFAKRKEDEIRKNKNYNAYHYINTYFDMIETGKWITVKAQKENDLYSIDIYKCPFCYCQEKKKSNYCPNCGHPMK